MIKILQFCALTLASLTNLTAQIPNAGFETWTSMGTYENPLGWHTLNNKTAAQTMFTATKATPGSPGTAYMKLTSKTIGGSVVPGIAVSGRMDTITMMPLSGFSYTVRSSTFGGKWQHMIYGGSQGSVMVTLTKWNNTQNKRDTIATGAQTLSGMAMSWANFSMSMMYVDSLRYPDSCIIVLRSSGSNPTNNDYLWVDNLAFSGSVPTYSAPVDPNPVGIDGNSNAEFNSSIFPNPSRGSMSLGMNVSLNERISVQIFDITGKPTKEFMYTGKVNGYNTFLIDTRDLPSGIYIAFISDEKTIFSKRLIIE